jgi:hypothetical protein
MVRQAAEQVRAAQAERVRLEQEIAARVPAREQLMAELAKGAREQGPARLAAAHRLQEFDAESALINTLISRR